MFQKTLSGFLIAAIMAIATMQPAFAASREEQRAQQAAKVKAGIEKLGVGEQSRVSLKLRDKTKRSGYISEIGDDSFVVVEDRSSVATRVAYPDVAQVKGHNLTTGEKVLISVAIGVGAALLVFFIVIAVAYDS